MPEIPQQCTPSPQGIICTVAGSVAIKCSANCNTASGGTLCYSLLLCLVFQGLLRNVDDSSGGVPPASPRCCISAPLPRFPVFFGFGKIIFFFRWPPQTQDSEFLTYLDVQMNFFPSLFGPRPPRPFPRRPIAPASPARPTPPAPLHPALPARPSLPAHPTLPALPCPPALPARSGPHAPPHQPRPARPAYPRPPRLLVPPAPPTCPAHPPYPPALPRPARPIPPAPPRPPTPPRLSRPPAPPRPRQWCAH